MRHRPSRGRERPWQNTAQVERRRLEIAGYAFLSVMLSGWIGYQLIEGLNPLDSLYMTIITVSTVGFREVVELSTGGRLLTIGLIIGGVLTISFATFTAAAFIVEGHLSDYLGSRRMTRAIDALDQHTIVCGFGRVGRHLALQLSREGSPFVVIDTDEEKVEESSDLGYLTLRGDASEEHVLHEAGIVRARALVASVNSDADNVLTTLTSKGLNPDCMVIARVKIDENERKLHRAGADRVISPSTIGGRRIAQVLTRPAVADFLDGIAGGAVDYTLEEVPVTDESELTGLSLKDARLRERFACTVVALRHSASLEMDTHPDPTSPLVKGDVLVVMGAEGDVSAMRDALSR